MQCALFAEKAGPAAPYAAQMDEAPAVASGQGSKDQQQNERADSRVSTSPLQAMQSRDGEACASEYLRRIELGVAEPGELTALITYLVEEAIYAACAKLQAAIEKSRTGGVRTNVREAEGGHA